MVTELTDSNSVDISSFYPDYLLILLQINVQFFIFDVKYYSYLYVSIIIVLVIDNDMNGFFFMCCVNSVTVSTLLLGNRGDSNRVDILTILTEN